MVAGELERIAPPGDPVVVAELGEPPRVVRALAATDLIRPPGHGVPDAGDERGDSHDRQQPGGGREQPGERASVLLDQAPRGQEEHPGHSERTTQNERDAEQAGVVDARGTAGTVLDERRAGERPRGDGSPGNPCDESEQRDLEPPPAAVEHEREHDGRGDDAGARLGEEEHDDGTEHEQAAGHAQRSAPLEHEPEPEREADVGEQREGVPVPDRLAQACDPVPVGCE